MAERGWIASGLRCLDLGAGTGALALGLAERGLRVVGIDISSELLAVARRRARDRGLDLEFVPGRAEDTMLPASSFDVVTAGQCWWWFDAETTISEICRLLTDGGRIIIANFSYVPMSANVARRTEDLILRHNPGWTKARQTGFYPEQVQLLEDRGFHDVESIDYLEDVTFDHLGWRGRIRACNGVGAALDDDAVLAFDRDLAKILADEYPPELLIPHRVHIVSGICPGGE